MTYSNLLPYVRRSTRLALAALVLAAPGVAYAQFDDPGLAPPPTTPPAAIPAQAPAKTTKKNTRSPDATPPAATRAPRSEGPQGTLISTDTKEETKTVAGSTQLTPDEWESRMVAPSLNGIVGLYHMATAEVGQPLNFRVASHLQFFSANSFLIKGNSMATPPIAGDQDQRFLGEFSLSLTGPNLPFLRNLEAYLTIYNASNQNSRPTEAGRLDPTVILSLADVGWGLKGAWYVGKGISLGGNVGVRFFNSVSGVAADFSATAVNIDLLGMFDVRKVAPSVPLRFHFSLGYMIDNSLDLLPTDPTGIKQCAGATMVDACIRSRVVETFAYGINTSRVRFALAAELPLRPKVSWGYFGVGPFVEYHLEAATTDGDTIVGTALKGSGVANQSNTLSQYLTIGLRLKPVARLVIDLGVDAMLMSPGYQYGPPLATWNVIVGAAYTYGAEGGSKTTHVTRTVTKTYEVNRRPPEGRIAGTVKDLGNSKPVAGAIITYSDKRLSPQSTISDGTFTSYNLPPGPTTISVSHPDYEPTSVNAVVMADGSTAVPITLKALPPKEGKVHVRVVDNKENPLLGATVKFSGPVTREAVLNGELFDAALPAGDYTMSVDAPNFLSREKQISVAAEHDKNIDVELTKRPSKSHVELTGDQIVIKGTIHFATNEAKILPDGQQLLDEVVDVLAKNPQIKKVSVEGHTDNVGAAEKNLQLSKDRAAAVVDYMVSKGISPDRLTSAGFGLTKPLVPNISPANRAKNRRVEFHIVDGSAGRGSSFPQ